MRIDVIPEGVLERMALAFHLVPTPFLNSFVGLIAARAIMAAGRLGIFQAATAGSSTVAEIAERCATDGAATEKLLLALVGAKLFDFRDGRYSLSSISKRWLRPDAPSSALDGVLSTYVAADALGRLEEYLRTGTAVDFHTANHPPEVWALYQQGMRSASAGSAREVARRAPVPRGARDLVDIGGGHGLHSIALCRRHLRLRAVILDLPQAVAPMAPLLSLAGFGERIAYQPGNLVTFDFGEDRYDVAFMSQVAHHFDDATNRDLARRVARALRPGGVFIVQEFMRPSSPRDIDQMAGLLNLFFGLTSNAGTWGLDDVVSWQRGAGLRPRRGVRLRTAPGVVQQAASKPFRT